MSIRLLSLIIFLSGNISHAANSKTASTRKATIIQVPKMVEDEESYFYKTLSGKNLVTSSLIHIVSTMHTKINGIDGEVVKPFHLRDGSDGYFGFGTFGYDSTGQQLFLGSMRDISEQRELTIFEKEIVRTETVPGNIREAIQMLAYSYWLHDAKKATAALRKEGQERARALSNHVCVAIGKGTITILYSVTTMKKGKEKTFVARLRKDYTKTTLEEILSKLAT